MNIEWIRPFDEDNYLTVHGDCTDEEILSKTKSFSNGMAQVVVCDTYSKLSGIKDIDNFKYANKKNDNALKVCDHLLMHSGNFVMKAF